MYASTTHCCEASPAFRSSAIAGRATLTTVESRKTTVEPRIAASSVKRWARVGIARSACWAAPLTIQRVCQDRALRGIDRGAFVRQPGAAPGASGSVEAGRVDARVAQA